MADLQVCYFCGSGPDASLGEYAVVPPNLDPTDDQQRSVVLCPDCREKLTTVMEPVVSAAQAAATASDETREDETDRGGGTGAADVDASTAGTSGAGDPTAADETAADETAEPGSTDDSHADPVGDDAGPTGSSPEGPGGADGEVDVPPPEQDDEDSDEVSIDPGSGAGGADPGGDEPAPDDQPGTPAGSSRAEEAGDPPSPDQTPPHADDELVGRNNEAYNKTLRLLQNREFPVERHEIEQVAANAYQLDPQEVSDAIDSLIRKGLLSQEGAHLQRP